MRVAQMAPNGVEIEPIASEEMQAEERRRAVERLRRGKNAKAVGVMALVVVIFILAMWFLT